MNKSIIVLPMMTQREYNQLRNKAEDEFLHWFLKEHEGDSYSQAEQDKLWQKKSRLEAELEQVNRRLDTIRDLLNQRIAQEKVWLAAKGIPDSWTEYKSKKAKV